MTTFSNNWFKADKNHSLVDSSNTALPHLFFDTTADLNDVDRTVNVIISTPKHSAHAYSVDLNSGQRHFTHSYCKQSDVWDSYSSSINRPLFSIGYIPRVLDQLGEAQKVIVWSKRQSFVDIALTNYSKVKLIGAYVEQTCPKGNCLGKSNWLSRLVFIGVDANDETINKINKIEEFKQVFNWDSSKAHLENIEGRNSIGPRTYPAIKVGKLIEYEDAYDYFKKRSLFFSESELKKIQRGCHALYDRLWEQVGQTRPEDKSAKTIAELKSKTELIESLKKNKLPIGFAERLKNFTRKYYNEVSTCEKFVYHGNVNENREAFWFLSYMSIYYRLHREGYYFNCSSRTWQRNILNRKGRLVHNLKRDIGQCDEGDLDQAMSYLPSFLNGLKGETDYFRFIDYDNHPFGTHNKLYSWVKVKSRKFDCSDDINEKILKEMKLFPEDVRWQKREVKDITYKEKTIL